MKSQALCTFEGGLEGAVEVDRRWMNKSRSQIVQEQWAMERRLSPKDLRKVLLCSGVAIPVIVLLLTMWFRAVDGWLEDTYGKQALSGAVSKPR